MTNLKPVGVSRWMWARIDAGADAVLAGVVAVWLQLPVGWPVHTAGLVFMAGAAAIIRVGKTGLGRQLDNIPSLLTRSNGVQRPAVGR